MKKTGCPIGHKQTPEHRAAIIAGLKNRDCLLCGETFKPKAIRSLRCFGCQKSRCQKCGVLISASLGRMMVKPRHCMKCCGVPVGSKRESHGYISIKTESGWKAEHRYNAEIKIGRKLRKGEVVHHIDGNPSNNEMLNLVVCRTNREHLDTYHSGDLKNPPTHHNGRRPKGSPGWKPIKNAERKAAAGG